MQHICILKLIIWLIWLWWETTCYLFFKTNFWLLNTYWVNMKYMGASCFADCQPCWFLIGQWGLLPSETFVLWGKEIDQFAFSKWHIRGSWTMGSVQHNRLINSLHCFWFLIKFLLESVLPALDYWLKVSFTEHMLIFS